MSQKGKAQGKLIGHGLRLIRRLSAQVPPPKTRCRTFLNSLGRRQSRTQRSGTWFCGSNCCETSTTYSLVKRTPAATRIMRLSKLRILPRWGCTACEYCLDVVAWLDSPQSRRWTDNGGIESPSFRSLRSRNTSVLLRDSQTSIPTLLAKLPFSEPGLLDLEASDVAYQGKVGCNFIP